MSENARIRINLNQREIEVAGDTAFVERYAAQLETMIGQLLQAPEPKPAAETEAAQAHDESDDLGTFGEFMHRLPNGATEVDKMLAAGYFCEANSGSKSFTTADANRRLLEQGIKVGNASQCVKQSLNAKRVFALSKGQYRVSTEGKRYLGGLLGEAGEQLQGLHP